MKKEEYQVVFEISDQEQTGRIVNSEGIKPYFFAPEVERKDAPRLPRVAEVEVTRHYTRLAEMNLGVDHTFYPLGSCTMKYNPRFSLRLASHAGATDIHPLQPLDDLQGALEVLFHLEQMLAETVGLHAVTLMPAAGAHGELTGLLILAAYLRENGFTKKKKIIVPDTAHGTNPASCTMAGFEAVEVKSGPEGFVRAKDVESMIDDETAGIMLTNPNTFGIFERDFKKIAHMVHEAGGLVYMDGANMNALLGIVRPGDMGADIVQLNLHKTFGTPHGGGGPGSGPVAVRDFLEPFLPGERIVKKDGKFVLEKRAHTIGRVRAFPGHFAVAVQALAYMIRLGSDGLKRVAEIAVLNARYLRALLEKHFYMPYATETLHEFVITDKYQKEKKGITALDMAKALLDRGFHPPTVYFPITVQGAIMIEPTETESKETLEAFARALLEIAASEPEEVKKSPQNTPVGRLDEVGAARNPRLRYTFPEG